MKTKTIILIGAAALVTFSFTFANVSNNQASTPKQAQASKTEPAGGFGAEEIVK